ncbi:ABC transporter permease [Synoicihabitans lomoniglobus]|uniref:ABC transporter permease n=1 Tax=Synoicihabitans lomoniglobus TaxID=2909285 RepID=A0AAE9ZXC7_9BACT|nr:ABC transporter permease [Opitutaceae bacterium LMO-M01]WED64974.1 ABC transporter permease [Opitutaceae bacterium LMO-M01]
MIRSLRQHALSTVVTALALALAGGLLLAVWVINAQAKRSFTDVATEFDAVLGARGSKLQLVLNAVFHLEASPGNIRMADYEQVRRHPMVQSAFPLAVGDNLRGFRVAGTVPEMLAHATYASGGVWSGPEAHEAVLGSFAARQLGLGVGDEFSPTHGLAAGGQHDHEDHYEVTGVLAPTNSPMDRVVWIPLHGVQTMDGHNVAAADQLSAVLIKLRSPAGGFMLDSMYNRQGATLTFAFPVAAIVADLFGKISWFEKVLALVANLVGLVAGATVLVAIYNSMSARRRDHAILRALGARRRTLFGVIVLEAITLGVMGMAGAFGVFAIIAEAIVVILRAETGAVIDPWVWHPVMAWAPAGLIALCGLGGMVPALKAYRTDVAEALSPTS